MLTLPSSVKVYLAAGVTDMRKSFDTLFGLARDALAMDPLSGHLFVFCNRGRNRIKVLHWDGSGLWIHAKRLEKGTFSWPDPGRVACVELRATDLAMLVGGIDLVRSRARDWYSHLPV